MFLIDKYSVKTLDDIFLHNDIYKNLIVGYNYDVYKKDINILNEILLEDNKTTRYKRLMDYNFSKPDKYNLYNNMPNLLIHGTAGTGKHTLIRLLLKDIFDDSIDNIFTEIYSIKGYSNSTIDVEIKQSKYHLIIEPNNSGFDKYLIQEIVKEYAKKKILNINYNKFPYRIVIINNIDNLNYYAQTSLRCTIEKYYNSCRFILCGKNISKIIEPLQSRCLNIRIPSPDYNEMKKLIYRVLLGENKKITSKMLNYIIDISNGNIKNIYWNLELYFLKIKSFELSWKKSLDEITNLIPLFLHNKNNRLINQLVHTSRFILYNIFTTNIDSILILQELINKIIYYNHVHKCLTFKTINNIIQYASEFETRLNKGKRSIIHLDTFVCKVFYFISINDG